MHALVDNDSMSGRTSALSAHSLMQGHICTCQPPAASGSKTATSGIISCAGVPAHLCPAAHFAPTGDTFIWFSLALLFWHHFYQTHISIKGQQTGQAQNCHSQPGRCVGADPRADTEETQLNINKERVVY